MKRSLLTISRLLVCTLAAWLFLTIPAQRPALAFDDVRNYWAQMDIELLVSHGAINGYPDGSFRPQKNITRAEFAKILIRALGMEDEVWTLEKVPSVFRDVGVGHWARGYVQVAYELGIIRGFDDGTFRPGDQIRRMDMAVMLERALRLETPDPKPPTFSDWDQVPAWARSEIAVASERKLIGGFPDNTFRPSNPATRAEATVMVGRLMDQFGRKYQLSGYIEGVDVNAGKLDIQIGDQRINANLASGVKVFLDGQPSGWKNVAVNLPKPAMINLDDDGAVNFVHVLSAPVKNSVKLLWSPSTISDSLSPDQEGPGKAGVSALNPGLETGTIAADAFSGASPGSSMDITNIEAGIAQLTQATGADGSGVLVAVIDTGIDPAHPDLQSTTTGGVKVVDFKDFTDEGRVLTGSSLFTGQQNYTIKGFSYNFNGLYSQNGIYHYGFLEEARAGVDLNGNGTTSDSFLVVVTDPWQAGRYDVVYVDTDGDRVLGDEVALREYRLANGFATFSGTGATKGVSFVVSEVKPGADEVVLGFDGNGHGTQVAGVAAANGQVKGAAPGALLLVIKAMGKDGLSDWNRLADAIRYAARAGAKVINLSLAGYRDVTSGNNSLTQLVDQITEQFGMVFTIAAGNSGPGLASLATPGNAASAIGVGAYISPAMWLEDYGYEVPHETLWYYSSVGPRQDGMMGPAVVAPGSAVTTAPTWMDSYSLVEGTSIASAQAAGVVALLLDSAARNGLKVSPASIKQAVMTGARPIKHFSPAEAGAGALNAAGAWSALRNLPPASPVIAYTYNRQLGLGAGLYARDFIPGQLSFLMTNRGGESINVFWEPEVPWMHPQSRQTLLPSGINRQLGVEYQIPNEPGLYTGVIRGVVPTTPGMDLRLMATIIRPYLLTSANGYRQELSGSIEAGQHQRYFFNVPSGTARASFKIKVPQAQGGYEGRVRMHLISPDGQETSISDYVGLGPEGTIVRGSYTATVDQPKPGNWEVVVYSSAALSLYGRQNSNYQITAGLSEVTFTVTVKPRWLIGLAPRELAVGKQEYITLQVRDPQTLRPVDTMLEVDGRVMQVRNGQVTFPVVPAGEEMTIKIS